MDNPQRQGNSRKILRAHRVEYWMINDREIHCLNLLRRPFEDFLFHFYKVSEAERMHYEVFTTSSSPRKGLHISFRKHAEWTCQNDCIIPQFSCVNQELYCSPPLRRIGYFIKNDC